MDRGQLVRERRSVGLRGGAPGVVARPRRSINDGHERYGWVIVWFEAGAGLFELDRRDTPLMPVARPVRRRYTLDSAKTTERCSVKAGKLGFVAVVAAVAGRGFCEATPCAFCAVFSPTNAGHDRTNVKGPASKPASVHAADAPCSFAHLLSVETRDMQLFPRKTTWPAASRRPGPRSAAAAARRTPPNRRYKRPRRPLLRLHHLRDSEAVFLGRKLSKRIQMDERCSETLCPICHTPSTRSSRFRNSGLKLLESFAFVVRMT